MTSSDHVNIPRWISENQKSFLPPVCNKLMYAGQLKVMYVGGPNIRKDFHLEEGEELFYMEKGDMNLLVLEKGRFKDIKIKEGQIFLLPGKIPHSPQRYEDTVGLVIERERLRCEDDCLRYFVGETTETLFERWFYCADLGVQLGPVIKEFFASEQHKTGKPIPETISKSPPWVSDAEKELEDPFSLNYWIMENFAEISREGKKKLFAQTYQSEITVYGPGEDNLKDEFEHWLWQIEGQSDVKINGKIETLRRRDSFLVLGNTPFVFTRPKGSIVVVVKMNPKNKK